MGIRKKEVEKWQEELLQDVMISAVVGEARTATLIKFPPQDRRKSYHEA